MLDYFVDPVIIIITLAVDVALKVRSLKCAIDSREKILQEVLYFSGKRLIFFVLKDRHSSDALVKFTQGHFIVVVVVTHFVPNCGFRESVGHRELLLIQRRPALVNHRDQGILSQELNFGVDSSGVLRVDFADVGEVGFEEIIHVKGP